MKSAGRVLRWAGAVAAGFIAYIAAFATGYLMWRRYGGDPADASRWILAIATCGAVLAGAFAAPRIHAGQRRQHLYLATESWRI
jgi:hypothetical protein